MGKRNSLSTESTEIKIVLPLVSVVVIGRNEAKNLPSCIRSIRKMSYSQDRLEVMYVDTDSTDGSSDVASSLGVKVYEEHSDFPSPGRARNRGWREAHHDLVHFVDGDMTVAPSYLVEAVTYLGADNVVCVIGRLEEHGSPHSLLSTALEYPWKSRQPGFVDAPGAGGTFLRTALAEIGGYNPEILKGQETELGRRLRACGYRILMIDRPMGVHDYQIDGFRDLWQRSATIGRSFARVLHLPPSESLASEQRAARRSLLQGVIAICAGGAMLLLGLWWVLLISILLLGPYVVVRYWRPAALRSQRIPYFLLDYYFKPAVWFGMVRYFVANRKP